MTEFRYHGRLLPNLANLLERLRQCGDTEGAGAVRMVIKILCEAKPDPAIARRLETAERLVRAWEKWDVPYTHGDAFLSGYKEIADAAAAYRALSTPDAPADAAKEGG